VLNITASRLFQYFIDTNKVDKNNDKNQKPLCYHLKKCSEALEVICNLEF